MEWHDLQVETRWTWPLNNFYHRSHRRTAAASLACKQNQIQGQSAEEQVGCQTKNRLQKSALDDHDISEEVKSDLVHH